MGDDDNLRQRLDLLGGRLDELKALEAQRQARLADKPVIERPETQWFVPAYATPTRLTPPEKVAGMLLILVLTILFEWLWPK